MNVKYRDIWFSVVMLFIGLYFLYKSFAVVNDNSYINGVSPFFFPKVLLLFWVVSCGYLLKKALFDIPQIKTLSPRWSKVLLAIVLSIVYALLLNSAGFLLSSIIYAAAFMLSMGYRRLFLLPISAIALPVFIWIVITQIFHIYLPAGVWM